MQVCALTTPAQLFHCLRRQMKRSFRKPLVIMTPKSLLRTRESFSDRSVLTDGAFARFMDDENAEADKIRRVMACTGKVYYDLVEERKQRGRNDVAIVRFEQLYPFPAQAFADCLARFPRGRELYWVQEEPQNMGAWTFMRPLLEAVSAGELELRYVGREASASPATGSSESHKLELELFLKEAFDNLPR
jgi:2-oxoglutarate dehydrogenase E1 component